MIIDAKLANDYATVDLSSFNIKERVRNVIVTKTGEPLDRFTVFINMVHSFTFSFFLDPKGGKIGLAWCSYEGKLKYVKSLTDVKYQVPMKRL